SIKLFSSALHVFGTANARRRDAMAAAAAPYVLHRLSSTEHSGPGGGTAQVIIQTGFVYDDAASARGRAGRQHCWSASGTSDGGNPARDGPLRPLGWAMTRRSSASAA